MLAPETTSVNSMHPMYVLSQIMIYKMCNFTGLRFPKRLRQKHKCFCCFLTLLDRNFCTEQLKTSLVNVSTWLKVMKKCEKRIVSRATLVKKNCGRRITFSCSYTSVHISSVVLFSSIPVDACTPQRTYFSIKPKSYPWHAPGSLRGNSCGFCTCHEEIYKV